MIVERNRRDSFIQELIPSRKSISRGLLVFTAAAAVISLIPPLRLGGSIATRAISLVSSSTDNSQGILTSAARVAVVGLGLAGLVAASPLLVIGSVAADIGLSVIEGTKAAFNDDATKALRRFTSIPVNALILTGLATGGWGFIFAASCVSIVAMTSLFLTTAAETKTFGDGIEAACYAVLIGTSMASAFSALKLAHSRYTNSQFSIHNTSQERMVIYNKKGINIASLAPGEKIQLEVPYTETLRHKSYRVVPGPREGSYTTVPHYKGSYVEALYFHDSGAITRAQVDAAKIDSVVEILKEPLAPQHFPTLPIGGHVLS